MKVACIWFEKPTPIEKLAEFFLRFSPQIALTHEHAIFVEIGKSKNLYSEADFILRVQTFLEKKGFHAQIAIGQEVTDALALAKFQVPLMEHLPLSALVAFSDPFMRDESLRKSVENLIVKFQDLGILTIGQFKKLPLGELISRFGVIGRFTYQRVHLQDFISWPLWTPEEIIFESKEFLHPQYQGDLEPLLFELKAHLDSIFAKLRLRQRQLTQLQVLVKCEKLSVHPDFLRTFNFEFFAPQNSAKSTLRILMERLHRQFETKPLKSAVELITTKVIKSVPYQNAQKNLLNNEEEKFEEIHSLHNQLVEILGKENVYQAKLTEDRRPERSWSKDFETPHQVSQDQVNLDVIPERSTYLCKTPIKIEVTAGYLHIKKQRYKILHWDKYVEKLSGAWFEDPKEIITDVYDRTYSQVIIENFQKISIFKTNTNEFYIHGYYG